MISIIKILFEAAFIEYIDEIVKTFFVRFVKELNGI